MAGTFIVFEGITGSGKKTHINLLAEDLRKMDKLVTLIAFPNFETDIARLTKKEDMNPYTRSLLYAADRSQYQERIKGLLERDYIVICDRYCYSNFAYQAARGIDLNWLMSLEKNIIKPSMVFLIDISVDAGMARISQSSIEDFTKAEMIDRLKREREILEKIRETYLYLAKNNPDKETKWFVIDGTQEVSKCYEQIRKIVREELNMTLY
jgi:dTMP kinase